MPVNTYQNEYYQALSSSLEYLKSSLTGKDTYLKHQQYARQSALSKHFPSLAYLFGLKSHGKEAFDALCKVYSHHFLSLDWDINLYGEDFAFFIAQQQQGPKGSEWPWQALSGVAALDFALQKHYYSDVLDITYKSYLSNVFEIKEHWALPDWLERLSLFHPYAQWQLSGSESEIVICNTSHGICVTPG